MTSSSSPSSFSPFIPAGSYQASTQTSSITVTLSANCKNDKGDYVASTLTYDQSQLSGIDVISNQDGALTLSPGTNQPVNESNNDFIPAGSYQESCSITSIEISALCQMSDGLYPSQASTVSYGSTEAESLTDIANDNSTLTLLTTPSVPSISTDSDDDDDDDDDDGDDGGEESDEGEDGDDEAGDGEAAAGSDSAEGAGDAAGEAAGESAGEAAGEAAAAGSADAAADAAAAAAVLCA